MQVKAQVVDIRIDTPKRVDRFYVDTNVWYWLTYTRATLGDRSPAAYQTVCYPKYVDMAMRTCASLGYCALSFAELAHLIERSERAIYTSGNPQSSPPFPKEYRRMPSERPKVVSEIRASWGQVKVMANCLFEATLDKSMIRKAFARLESCPLDGYDALALAMVLAKDVTQVITDDSDFGAVPGITVFTANQYLIRRARACSRLVPRS